VSAVRIISRAPCTICGDEVPGVHVAQLAEDSRLYLLHDPGRESDIALLLDELGPLPMKDVVDGAGRTVGAVCISDLLRAFVEKAPGGHSFSGSLVFGLIEEGARRSLDVEEETAEELAVEAALKRVSGRGTA
jgi:hypothetical protein